MDAEISSLLLTVSDLPKQQYDTLVKEGRTMELERSLIRYSKIPEIRNLCPPFGEVYAPVTYNSDYMIKLVNKPRWGGYILTVVLWTMLVIDIDNDDEDIRERIRSLIMRYYPDDLFYLHRTPHGYHVYMVSRQVDHLSKFAVYARIKLESDPAHGTNSLYTGNSIRISRKSTDPDGPISTFIEKIGNGLPDPSMQALYTQIVQYITTFGNLQIDPTDHYEMLLDLHKGCPRDFGYTHVEAVAPLRLADTGLVPNPSRSIRNQQFMKLLKSYWSKFIRYRVLKESRLPYLLLMCQYNMCDNNLYRIFEATEDYAIGVHVQQNCHFISYKDLLVVDYDHNRRGILYRYIRGNGVTFRIVKTTKGYHAFLTSYPVNHREGIETLVKLCADPCHIVGSYHRGYSVRINKKSVTEAPYREVAIAGKAPEDPRLVTLYKRHLELYGNSKCKIMGYQTKVANDIIDELAENLLPGIGKK